MNQNIFLCHSYRGVADCKFDKQNTNDWLKASLVNQTFTPLLTLGTGAEGKVWRHLHQNCVLQECNYSIGHMIQSVKSHDSRIQIEICNLQERVPGKSSLHLQKKSLHSYL